MELREMLASCESVKLAEDEPKGDLLDRSVVFQLGGASTWSRNRVLHELAETDAALSRLATGTYGICELTHEPISEARLLAIPTARRDLVSQKSAEQHQRLQFLHSYLTQPSTHLQENDEAV